MLKLSTTGDWHADKNHLGHHKLCNMQPHFFGCNDNSATLKVQPDLGSGPSSCIESGELCMDDCICICICAMFNLCMVQPGSSYMQCVYGKLRRIIGRDSIIISPSPRDVFPPRQTPTTLQPLTSSVLRLDRWMSWSLGLKSRLGAVFEASVPTSGASILNFREFPAPKTLSPSRLLPANMLCCLAPGRRTIETAEPSEHSGPAHHEPIHPLRISIGPWEVKLQGWGELSSVLHDVCIVDARLRQ